MGGQWLPLQIHLEPVETMVRLSSKSSDKFCAELPKRERRISVRVKRACRRQASPTFRKPQLFRL
jgi:hypothetical protein